MYRLFVCFWGENFCSWWYVWIIYWGFYVRFEEHGWVLMASLGHGVAFLCGFWSKGFVFDDNFGLRTVFLVYTLK